ncbi:uncharacterized protein PHALS_11167 [Plasmopara halstedii]|uniref:Uncharacterized protein n=1 Tax=Plasmopara halstedii TaxID=4781 RepID=A0A0P1AIM5_PLAHL|nr:uncharacterized protein PHALS_11167 [Plasmopara halstedii]CEG40994.1 hypothetical protein PHALS_11167 [Plasmopara halstedii]|eukprot:XP_024577363.1 hypothetical protein PHALS_11167 [Plasmopara halstedii]
MLKAGILHCLRKKSQSELLRNLVRFDLVSAVLKRNLAENIKQLATLSIYRAMLCELMQQNMTNESGSFSSSSMEMSPQVDV